VLRRSSRAVPGWLPVTEIENFVEGLLNETRDEISRADTKANILLALAGVAVAALAAGLISADLTLDGEPGLVQALASVAIVMLSAGVLLLAWAVLPRIGRPTKGRARYFMDHAQYDDVADFRAAVHREAQNVDERHLRQLLDLSKIVRRKYRLTQIGELLTGLGYGCVAAAVLAHHIAG